MRKHLGNQEGQLALAALGIMAVMMVVGLLVGQRVILQQRSGRSNVEVSEAQREAEEIMERLLSEDLSTKIGSYPDEGYAVRTAETLDNTLLEGRTYDLWVQGDSSFDLAWSGACTGVLLTFMNETQIERRLYLKDYDPIGAGACEYTGSQVQNAINVPDGTSKTINIAGDLGWAPELVRIKALFGEVGLEVTNASNLALGYEVETAGQVGDGASVNIVGTKSGPQLPSIFDYALFSGGSITK